MSAIDSMLTQVGGSRNFNHYDNAAANNAAMVTLNITRVGTADGVLEIPLFGALAAVSGYGNLGLTGIAGVEFGLFGGNAFADFQKVIFSGAADTVTVTATSAAPYPSLVYSLLNSTMRVKNVRYSLSQTTDLTQFNETLNVNRETPFGKTTGNSINPIQYKDPRQFQSGIIDIPQGFSIDSNTFLLTNVVAVAQTISLSLFIESFEQIRS